MIEAAGLDPTLIRKFVAYGEFLCNGFYDYGNRDIVGDWKVFGAQLETNGASVEVLAKLPS